MNQYVADLQIVNVMSSYRSAFPSLFKYSVRFGIPLPFLGKAQGFNIRIQKYATESLQRHRDLVEKEGPDARSTVFTKVYKAQGNDSITPEEVRNNAQSYVRIGPWIPVFYKDWLIME